jgi:hypothetical protein
VGLPSTVFASSKAAWERVQMSNTEITIFWGFTAEVTFTHSVGWKPVTRPVHFQEEEAVQGFIPRGRDHCRE